MIVGSFLIINLTLTLLQSPAIKLPFVFTTIYSIDNNKAFNLIQSFIILILQGMDEDEEEVVPLPNVNAGILKKVKVIK
jgi:hypothetical protein